MKVAGNAVHSAWMIASALLFAAFFATSAVDAQAPYLLPYAVTSVLGGGAATTAGGSCTGANGSTVIAGDAFGDGCLATTAKTLGVDLHDVAVDQQGNVYFIDNGSYGTVRRIDARTGVVTVLVGGFYNTTLCNNAIDKYGDGCPASDMNAAPYVTSAAGVTPVTYDYPGGNQIPGYSTDNGKFRGLGVNKNGDVYIADYTDNVIHKISAATGLYQLVAGTVTGTSVKTTSGVSGTSGDKGPATSARVYAPRGVIADASGNIIIADTSNNLIRVVYAGGTVMANLITLLNPGVTPTVGNIYTIAGVNNGVSVPGSASGYGGDGGIANSAAVLFATPEDVLVDANDNIFIGDFGNNRVRVIYSGGAAVAHLISVTNSGAVAQPGYIYSVVGGGTATYTSPSVVLATSVPIGNPRKLTIDAAGNLYIADSTYDMFWFVDATTGYMRVIAGQSGVASNGTYCAAKTDVYGDGCPGLQATFGASSELAVAVDPNENLYVNDPGDSRIRKISTDQVFPATTLGAPTTQTLVVHFAAGDSAAAAGAYTITGSSDFTFTPGTCTSNPDTTVDCQVNVTLTPSKPGPELALFKIVSSKGATAAFGLSGEALAPALVVDPGMTAAVATGLSAPFGVTQDLVGNTFIADTGNNRIVEVSTGGTQTVIAGTGAAGYTGDGAVATAATLSGPKGVAVGRNGAVYIADTGNNVVRRIDPVTGFISTYGGAGASTCLLALDTLGDGCAATAATFKSPTGVTVDLNGNVYVTDAGNNLVREITPSGYIFQVAGGASTVCTAGDTYGNGCGPLASTFSNPTGITVDAFNSLYIADTGDNEVRKIAGNLVTLVAGNGGQSGYFDNGDPATTANLTAPTGVAVDAAGDVYIADTGNNAIRIVNATKDINTVAGLLGQTGTGTLPGIAYNILLNAPAAVTSNGSGQLVVLDSGNNRAFSVSRTSLAYAFDNTDSGSTSPSTTIQETNSGSEAVNVGASTTGNNTGTFFTTSGATGSFAVAPASSSGCSASSSTPQSLAPGASCAVTATFTPTAAGAVTATYTDGPATPVVAVLPSLVLSGTGIGGPMTTSSSVLAPPSPQFGAPFTITTTVTPASCNHSAPTCFPTGTVTFFIDGIEVGTGVVNAAGVAVSPALNGQGFGAHSVVSVYNGDSYYASSTAPAVAINISIAGTGTTVSANPASVLQFSPLTLTANVQALTTSVKPTGTASFYVAGQTAPIATNVSINAGVATITDASNSFGLAAGTYSLTAVYNPITGGNYGSSTSAPLTLVIQPDAPAFQFNYNTPQVTSSTPLSPAYLACPIVLTQAAGYNNNTSTGSPCQGTAQGSTAQDYFAVMPTNTLSGTMTFACTGMPTNSVCTFQPTSLTFTPVSGQPSSQQVQVTLWTDIPPGTNPAQATLNRTLRLPGERTVSVATLLGWPVLLFSLVGMVGLRRRMGQMRLLAMFVLCGLLAGSSALLTGCFNAKTSPALTPTGVYTVNITATGPNGLTRTLATPITFTVGTGVPGQE